MPRKSRIDAPGALHHIIARGIERRRIFGYQYCGHSVLMAKRKNDWQDTDKVLGMFGDKAGPARCAYRAFVKKGITQGKRSDLTGGGLVRSAGGWAAVKALKRAKIFW